MQKVVKFVFISLIFNFPAFALKSMPAWHALSAELFIKGLLDDSNLKLHQSFNYILHVATVPVVVYYTQWSWLQMDVEKSLPLSVCLPNKKNW